VSTVEPLAWACKLSSHDGIVIIPQCVPPIFGTQAAFYRAGVPRPPSRPIIPKHRSRHTPKHADMQIMRACRLRDDPDVVADVLAAMRLAAVKVDDHKRSDT